jgi:hypothetical protein
MSEVRWKAFRRMLWIWLAWECIYLRLHPVTAVRQGSLFAFRRRGRIVELHLDGRALARRRRDPGYKTFQSVHQLRGDLTELAAKIRRGELGDVLEITGTSLMGEAGGVLGFETRPLPRNFANVLKQYFMVGLDAIYNPRGLRERSMRRWPVESSMSVNELLRRYEEKSSGSTSAR